MLESGHRGRVSVLMIVGPLGFRGWSMPEGLEKAAIVEPVDPLEGRELDVCQASPRSAPPVQFRLEEADDRLRQCVVVRVAGASDRRFEACLQEALGVPERQVLRAPVAVMDYSVMLRPGVEGLLECVQRQVASKGTRRAPADDTAREDVRHEGVSTAA